MLQETQWAGHVAAMVSEEMDGFYCGADPLPARQVPAGLRSAGRFEQPRREHDAWARSSASCGTPTRRPTRARRTSCSPGVEQVCAGFALYGPATMLVLTTGRGVDGFTLDREIGAFVLTHPQMRIPDERLGVRDQRVQRAVLGAAGQALRAGVPGRRRGQPGQGLHHAMGGLAGGRHLPHPDPGRDVPGSHGRHGPEQVRWRAAAVRGEPDRVHHRAGGWGRVAPAAAGHGADAGRPAPDGCR